MHRKTTENAVFTRNFEFIDPLRSFDRNMVFNYTNLTIRKGLYKAKGYFCGSGAIESGNKIVLQKRLKQAGMRWEPQTAQYLLTLKTKYESGRWERDVVDFIKGHLSYLEQN